MSRNLIQHCVEPITVAVAKFAQRTESGSPGHLFQIQRSIASRPKQSGRLSATVLCFDVRFWYRSSDEMIESQSSISLLLYLKVQRVHEHGCFQNEYKKVFTNFMRLDYKRHSKFNDIKILKAATKTRLSKRQNHSGREEKRRKPFTRQIPKKFNRKM